MSLRDSLRGLFAKPYQRIHAVEASARMDAGAILLDVRESHEWQAGHAQGARHIPLGQLGQRMRELPGGRPVIAVCRSGARSARAASLLAGQGSLLPLTVVMSIQRTQSVYLCGRASTSCRVVMIWRCLAIPTIRAATFTASPKTSFFASITGP